MSRAEIATTLCSQNLIAILHYVFGIKSRLQPGSIIESHRVTIL
jgi:hypothetical protein